MIYWGAALLLAALGGAPDEAAAPEPVQYAQLTLRQQIMIRVPVRLRPGGPQPEQMDWKEGKRTRCVAAGSVAGAKLLERNSVDLVLRDRSRVRAKLQKSCPALDYYHGFYISPSADGRICADRETIRSRMGGECEIDAFKVLKPVKRK